MDRPDGGQALYDPLLDRVTTLTAAEANELDTLNVSESLGARLTSAMLLEGPVAQRIRGQILAARVPVAEVEPPSSGSTKGSVLSRPDRTKLSPSELSHHHPEVTPPLRDDFPPEIDPRWRAFEPWRQLREARLSGGEALALDGFLSPQAAAQLAAIPLTFHRLDTPLVHADRAPWTSGGAGDVMDHPAVRSAIAWVFDLDPLGGIVANTWRMAPGDHMGVHPDGRRYQITFSLGLTPDWRAENGGAIAFGTPTAAGFEVRERWLPHLGNLLLFAPHALSFHAVEPVLRGVRLSWTGWYCRQ